MGTKAVETKKGERAPLLIGRCGHGCAAWWHVNTPAGREILEAAGLRAVPAYDVAKAQAELERGCRHGAGPKPT